MRKIAFINEKGGSCKTTLTVNVGAYLALREKARVLIIDMDPQGHAGKCLGLDARGAEVTVYDLLTNPKMKPVEATLPTRIEGLDVIVSNKRLSDFDVTVAADSDRVRKLMAKVERVYGYDYILFDSPPSLGLLTLNIMNAAEEVIVPVSLTFLAMDGCAEILETVEQVRRTMGVRRLRVSMVVPTLYRNTRLANEILERLKARFGDVLSHAVIRYDVKIDEAQSHGRTIWEYAPRSRGAEMFADLAREIRQHG
ncbi:MAG: ParA family protein [Myxococcales bacterium]|nr:ParA family protein [Myxococcales bacterium]